MRFPTRIKEVPAHIRASWTPEELAFYTAVYDRPRLGPEWITAHRKIEMTLADSNRRDFFMDYWPDEALNILESFKSQHYDAKPDKGLHAQSRIIDRLEVHYPRLFKLLDTRLGALPEACTTHPHLVPYWHAYRELKAVYWTKLNAAIVLTEDIQPAKMRHAERHELYRKAFAQVCPRLRDLIDALVLMGR